MSAEAKVLTFADLPVVDRGTGVTTRLLVHRGLGSESLTNGFTRFEPGAKIALHTHNCDESVVVAEGEAICEIDGVRVPMRQWDTTFVPAGVPHRFLNESGRPMAILWTYAAGTVTRTFVETGITVEHMSVDDRAVAPR
ncbi:MAG: cupin domain-containing protein [Chloroflexi bacterium]|nr:cupin domain-containing protein [Chloroflexota bacterium]